MDERHEHLFTFIMATLFYEVAMNWGLKLLDLKKKEIVTEFFTFG